MKVITPDDLKKRIEETIEKYGDDPHEDSHPQLDNLLCETLRSLGYKDAIELYNSVGKWYC